MSRRILLRKRPVGGGGGGGTLTFAQEQAATEQLLSAYSFDSLANVRAYPVSPTVAMRYVWESATAPACDSAGLGTQYSLGETRGSGEGNAVAYQSDGVCHYPAIDTSIKHDVGGGAGSLRISIPSKSAAGTGGFFSLPIQGTLGLGSNFPFIGSTTQSGDPNYLGNILYCKWRQRFNPEMFQAFEESPGVQTSWKQVIFFGDPPSTSSDEISIVVVRHISDLPTMYGHTATGADDVYGIEATKFPQDILGCNYGEGGHTYPEPPCFHYLENEWMEFLVRIEILGASAAAASLVQMWVNGLLVVHMPTARITWGSVDKGIGSFHLSTYCTNKDVTQVHSQGETWFDDVMFSTTPPPQGHIPLESLVSRMSNNSRAELKTFGGMASIFEDTELSTGSQIINGYAPKMVYDSVRKQLHFTGADHHPDSGALFKHVRQDLAKNEWKYLGEPSWHKTLATGVHGYSSIAIDSVNRRLYFIPFNSTTVRWFDLDADDTTNSSNWNALPSHGGSAGQPSAIEWFPEYGSQGSLIFIGSENVTRRWDKASNAWSVLEAASGYGSTWTVLQYNPVLQEVLMTGNLNKLRVINSSGTITSKADVTATHYTYDGSGYTGLWTVDPVSGLYVVVTDPTTGRDCFKYNSATDSFSSATALLAERPLAAFSACPVGNAVAFAWATNSGGAAAGMEILKGT